jgi:CheY-like chemotaxis protein
MFMRVNLKCAHHVRPPLTRDRAARRRQIRSAIWSSKTISTRNSCSSWCSRWQVFAIRTAHNGEEALRALVDKVPSVMIVDLMMPVLDGIEFRAIQRKSANSV